MNIYKILRDDNVDWDEYIGFVVVAHTEYEAAVMAAYKEKRWLFCKSGLIPCGDVKWKKERDRLINYWGGVPIEKVGIYNGDKTEPFVLLDSYKAG